MLDLEHPPVLYQLELKGLAKNQDGLYLFSQVRQRLAQALAAYDQLPKKQPGLAPAA